MPSTKVTSNREKKVFLLPQPEGGTSLAVLNSSDERADK
jgi:hypothetical protein